MFIVENDISEHIFQIALGELEKGFLEFWFLRKL